ncbi:hypothetical protein [Roseateles sp. P5_E7]
MNKMRWIATLSVLGCTLCATLAEAQQPTQTADGAQKFLATLVAKGNATTWFVDAQNRRNYVRNMAKVTTVEFAAVFFDDPVEWQKPIEKQLLPFTLSEIDTLGPKEKPDACMTRLAKWRVNEKEQMVETQTWRTTKPGFLKDQLYEHRLSGTYEPSPELLAPHWIDWRNVTLTRTPEGTQMTASFKGKDLTANLAFSGETELIDRVEYAMKFLKMSCDDSTATGF